CRPLQLERLGAWDTHAWAQSGVLPYPGSLVVSARSLPRHRSPGDERNSSGAGARAPSLGLAGGALGPSVLDAVTVGARSNSVGLWHRRRDSAGTLPTHPRASPVGRAGHRSRILPLRLP